MDSAVEDMRATRRSLHGVAELLMAGPQYRQSGTIRLRVFPEGFSTVAEPDVRVQANVLQCAGLRLAMSKASGGAALTYAQLAGSAGIDIGAPEGLYPDSSGVSPDEEIAIDKASAVRLMEVFDLGDTALRSVAPDKVPVLWPEHFDLGVTLDEVNYGVSLGDATVDEPYAYVAPWKPRTGAFWNVSFGAARPMRELRSAAAVSEFFAMGQRLALGRSEAEPEPESEPEPASPDAEAGSTAQD